MKTDYWSLMVIVDNVPEMGNSLFLGAAQSITRKAFWSLNSDTTFAGIPPSLDKAPQ